MSFLMTVIVIVIVGSMLSRLYFKIDKNKNPNEQ